MTCQIMESKQIYLQKTEVHFRPLAIKIYYLGLKKILSVTSVFLKLICSENKKDLNWIEYRHLI